MTSAAHASPLASAIARATSAASASALRPSIDARPVTLDELAGVRADLACMQRALEDLLWSATDATSGAPVSTVEAQRLDIARHGAELRAVLQLCMARIDAIRALVQLHDERRSQRPRKACPR